jgi:hypothetical protein
VFEGGTNSTGQYGVTADELYWLFSISYGYTVSTMKRWLDHQRPFRQEEFRQVWNDGSDWYFLASPE